MTELKIIEPNNDTRMCSFDIKNMYTNIPRKDIINIINNTLDNNVEIQSNIRKEIIYIENSDGVFQFDQKYYKQMEGLAMGAPTSAILAETYIPNSKHATNHCVLSVHIRHTHNI
jgi:hypothetical protein